MSVKEGLTTGFCLTPCHSTTHPGELDGADVGAASAEQRR